MKKALVVLGVVAALAIPTVATAVDLHTPHKGTTCSDGGKFHFVANGVAGKVGSLTVWFNGQAQVIGESVKYNRGTNHWTIEAFGTLTGATATEGTKLVLSDYDCYEKKDD